MRWRVLTIGTTDIYLHLATLLFGAYAWWLGYGPLLAASLLSIFLHEAAHAAVAALAGRMPGEIEISPLGAVLRLEDEARLPPFRRALMLAAGPAMTFALCFLSIRATAMGFLTAETGRLFFMSNLSILLMNLLPALPLDGGRLLALLLGCMCRPSTVRTVMRIIGSILGTAAIIGNVYISWTQGGWNLSLASAGCFLLYSAATGITTQAMAELRRFMDRKIWLEKQGSAPCRNVAILSGQPLHHALRRLAPRCVTLFTLIEPGTMKRIGLMTEHQLIAAYLDRPEQTCLEAFRQTGGNA